MESGYSDILINLNFSRTVAGITKWFWVPIEGYLSYLLPKFEDLVPLVEVLEKFKPVGNVSL